MMTRPTRRSAFTLVELLIVITVIGILVGLLVGAVVPAFKRANEFTIIQEMSQLERSVENFKIKYGFYPPSFVRIQNNDIDGNGTTSDEESIAALLPYINRIAPNHNETAINPDTGISQDVSSSEAKATFQRGPIPNGQTEVKTQVSRRAKLVVHRMVLCSRTLSVLPNKRQ